MSEKPISPLRRRMIEDMSVRKFGEKTQHDYIRHIENFAKFLGRSPDTATAEDLRRYQVHQTAAGVQPPSVNSSAVALRFLFTVTLGRANLATQLTRVHYPRRLPRVLSPEEVARLLEAAPGPGLKYKAALSVAYGAGLRASEVVSLKVSDVDSKCGPLRGTGLSTHHSIERSGSSAGWRHRHGVRARHARQDQDGGRLLLQQCDRGHPRA
jgi:integrase/recombinase XerD